MAETSVIARITLASHFFKVDQIQAEMRPLVRYFLQQFKQYGWEETSIFNDRKEFVRKQNVRVVKAMFAAFTKSGSEARFHINTWPAFQGLLKARNIGDYQLQIETLPFLPSPDIEFVMYPEWRDREHQVPVIAYSISPLPTQRKMLPLRPGRGKSYVTMRMSQELRARTVYVMRKGYIEKWRLDFAKTYDLDPLQDILEISGKDEIMALTHMAVRGEVDAKIIMISNTTWMRFIDLYEALEDEILNQGYACRPDELFGLMGARLRAIDEAHQDYNANFRQDLYTHIPWSVSLSGSMESSDLYITQMFEVGYPFGQRYHGDIETPYVMCTGVYYRFQSPRAIRSVGFQGAYSQVRFEQSILRTKSIRDHFMQMVCYYLDQEFRLDWQDADRLIMYVGTVEMASYVVGYLQRRYPEKRIARYCRTEKDVLTDVIEAQVIVSTLQSAGTNVDIPGLRTVMLLLAVDATAANIQGWGRLRDNMRAGIEAKFFWFTNTDHPKHMRYHRNKEQLLHDRAKFVVTGHYPTAL